MNISLVLFILLALFGMSAEASAEIQEEAEEAVDCLLLINRENRLSWDYAPQVVVLPEIEAAKGKGGNIFLLPEVKDAIERLFDAALVEEGYHLYAVSGFRAYETQRMLYTRKVSEVGEKQAMRVVAPPGASEHQTGLAMDINGETTVKQGLVQEFGNTPEGIWVAQNAHRFGFIIRYPKGRTDITGYAWEPWHIRYVGEAAASEITSLGLTLEEYHALMRQQTDEGVANSKEEEPI